MSEKPNGQQQAPAPVIEHDGSLDAAVANMPDLDAPAPQTRAHGPDGKFVSQKQPPAVEPQKAVDAKQLDPAKVEQKQPAAEEEDDELIEWAAEEGKEPERFKLSEVFEGFQKSKELAQQVEALKQAKPLPQDAALVVRETMQQRSRYIAGLQQLQQLLAPAEPDVELLNQRSSKYDPDAYYEALTIHRERMEQRQKVDAELEREEAAQAEQQQLLMRSHMISEQTQLYQAWPEIKDKAYQEKFYDFLTTSYGIDKATVKQVTDHRFYLLARDAMNGRAAAAKTQEAVKTVRAKPRLVRSQARTGNATQGERLANAKARLEVSHSLDDAAEVLGGLLN